MAKKVTYTLTDEQHAKMVDGIKAYWSNPDNRKAQSDRMKEAFSDPTKRANLKKGWDARKKRLENEK